MLGVRRQKVHTGNPRVRTLLAGMARTRSGGRPRLLRIRTLFHCSLLSLRGRLSGRRGMLFPCICRVFRTGRRNLGMTGFRYNAVLCPVRIVRSRRGRRKRHFRGVSSLAGKFATPRSTYTDFHLILRRLGRFRRTLRRRVRLRGGVVFPETLRLRGGRTV